ncbi:MAG: DUF998 domain-containing protein [Pseudomonadota bacterium]|nr:DUF998 domain-containing protein [Pseudomonadota bacterium]
MTFPQRVSTRALKPWQLAGMVAFVPHLAVVTLASWQRPSFSQRAQYLSELGERGSPTSTLTNLFGVFPTGLLFLVFGIGVIVHYRRSHLLVLSGALVAVHGVARIAAAFFPCDAGCRPSSPSLSQGVHNFAATLAMVALCAALFFAGAWLIRKRKGVLIISLTYFFGLVAVTALMALAVWPDESAGLYRRVALGSMELWVTVFAVFLAIRPLEANDA